MEKRERTDTTAMICMVDVVKQIYAQSTLSSEDMYVMLSVEA